MKRLLTATTLACLGLLSCSGTTPGADGGTGAGTGGGAGGGGGTLSPWAITQLDPAARDATYFAIAVDPAQERIGVAYFTPRGTETMMGRPDYDLKYLEWKQGVVTGPETLRYMQTMIGLSVAFHPTTGEPVVAYLGGANHFIPGDSIYWFQSDAALSTRSGGAWTETIVATTGGDVRCGNPVSDRGLLVGLWPTVIYDATGKLYFAYRDGHDGQYPQQDWNGSDVELWEGTPLPTVGSCLREGGNSKQAWGGHLQFAMGPGNQPAVVYDQMFGTSDINGTNVIFQMRKADGTWTPSSLRMQLANTQTGPSLAWDEAEGFGIAAVDRATNQLSYVHSVDGLAWSSIDPVFGTGSGGWYPSLAMDPLFHEPAIAFYVCSPKSGLNETSCTTTEDELRITQRVGSEWRETVVDPDGAYAPKLGFFASGKRFVVYRQPPSVDPVTGLTVTNVGALKLAVER